MTTAEVAAVSGAAATLGSASMNAIAQGKINKKTREWNEKMYARQRADSLADYNMQNEYNSPTSQMERLRKAGLNPMLVYKNGATQEAAGVRSAQAPAWNPRAPEFDLSGLPSSVMGFMDARVKEAQIDNLKAANTVAIQEAALKAAQVVATMQGTKQSEFALEQSKALSSTAIETAKAELEKIKTDTYVTLSTNERNIAQTSQSLKEGAERILSIRAQRANTETERKEIEQRIKNLQSDNRLKELDIELKRNGIQPNDALWFRILGRLLGGDALDNLKPPAWKLFETPKKY